MFNKTKIKNKKWFCKSCLQCFSNEKVLEEHEDCLMISGCQNERKDLLNLTILIDKYQFHLKFMLILNVY